MDLQDLINKWEASGVLYDLSLNDKLKIIPMLEKLIHHILDDHITPLSPIDGIIVQVTRKLFIKYGNKFDTITLYLDLKDYWYSDETQSMMMDLNVYRNIDVEAEIMCLFCEQYIPKNCGFSPQKRVRNHRLKPF